MSDMHVGGQRYGKNREQERWLTAHRQLDEVLQAGIAPGYVEALLREAGERFQREQTAPPPPPEESLCGEEETLAAGSFGDPSSEAGPLPGQLQAWARHVRGVGRSRQSAYAEALSLAQMQFAAWQEAFPVAAAQAFAERGEQPLSPREQDILGMFSAGFSAFLGETQRIAQEGGR